MNIFDFNDYKKFVSWRLEQMPKRGYGQYRKMSNFLSVNSVNISQIFKGDRHLSVEQAVELCEFFGLSELESQYWVGLVEWERAGTHKLKKMISKRLDSIRENSQDLKHRLSQQKQLSDESKAIFYSHWNYSGVRLLTSIKAFQSPDTIAEYFGLSIGVVNRVLEFLIQYGLVVEEKGRYQMGPSSTHLEASSPLVSRHHTNWRMKGLEKVDSITTDELFLTMPCTISEKALKEIRKTLVNAIEQITRLIDESPSEQLVCMNMDLFRVD